jgi:GH15 family glucan-1,4-alpha-glucosidase
VVGRPVVLSNNQLFVGLNEHGLVHDFYYPYVGLDNLTTSRSTQHKIGVWVDGQFSWIDDGSWQTQMDFEEDALVSKVTVSNQKLGVQLYFNDFIDERFNAFCRIIYVKNLSGQTKNVRLFMHQVFEISRRGRGDTVLFVPQENYVLDYKGRCALLIFAQDQDGKVFDNYAVGLYDSPEKEGTYRDAEDGELSNNPVEHGPVDSVIRCSLTLEPGAEKKVDYWVIAADSQLHAEGVHQIIKQIGLQKRLERTRDIWNQWLATAEPKLSRVDERYRPIAKKSLLIIKAHIDRHGGIIASCDSSIYNYNRDYYSYVWPRDGALTMLTLIDYGYTHEPKRFLDFCADTINPAGYMMHKYQPDRAIGSTWHPLLHKNHPELAIQEDETASVVLALAAYLEKTGDRDYLISRYEDLLKPAANFMAGFFDITNLPHSSYDLWEEKFATHTYTAAITAAALKKAANVASQLGRSEDAPLWQEKGDLISDSLNQLFNEAGQYFNKSQFLEEDGQITYDDTLDISSAYGVMIYDDSQKNIDLRDKSFATIENRLLNKSPSGGLPRYERDKYFLDDPKYLGNPWVICTLWLAQYYARKNNPNKCRELVDWSIQKAAPSGALSEQIHPETGAAVSVLPLVWSHAVLLDTLSLLYG